jgi:hypothetical protein
MREFEEERSWHITNEYKYSCFSMSHSLETRTLTYIVTLAKMEPSVPSECEHLP